MALLKIQTAADGHEIDVWPGTKKEKQLEYIACTADLLKKDTEVKLLLGCTEEEKEIILSFHNNSEYMSAICMTRNAEALHQRKEETKI